MMTNLAGCVKLRGTIRGNEIVKHGGLIVNTSGFLDREACSSLEEAIKIFDINVVIVMDDEKLMSRLLSNSTFKAHTNQNGTPMTIEKIVKSGGVVPRNAATRAKEFGYAIKEYFYGSRCQGGHTLRPHRVVISFDDLQIYRIGGHKVPSYLLPAGAASAVEPCQLLKVEPAESFLHALAGLSLATNESELRTANIAGLIHFQAIDMIHKRYTLLVPSPGALPGKLVILGSMKWLDTS
jgi:polyribonucleotide 5'-hydroxyl-kinase